MADRMTFSSSVRLKYQENSKIQEIVVNKLYSFPKDWTWADVLNDIIDPDEFSVDKIG